MSKLQWDNLHSEDIHEVLVARVDGLKNQLMLLNASESSDIIARKYLVLRDTIRAMESAINDIDQLNQTKGATQ